MQKVIAKLKKNHQTISTMESCTGGGVANAITDIEGVSETFHFSAITYSNDAKIAMGVSAKVIEKYGVYSIETAREMSRSISAFANSDYGIGITGKLNRPDSNNEESKDDIVYISIYSRDSKKYYDFHIRVTAKSRQTNKQLVINAIKDKLLTIL